MKQGLGSSQRGRVFKLDTSVGDWNGILQGDSATQSLELSHLRGESAEVHIHLRRDSLVKGYKGSVGCQTSLPAVSLPQSGGKALSTEMQFPWLEVS